MPVTKDATEGPLYLYVLAQIHARLGQHAAAFTTLDRLFSVPGFYSESWVRRDPGFAARWARLGFVAAEASEAVTPTTFSPSLEVHQPAAGSATFFSAARRVLCKCLRCDR